MRTQDEIKRRYEALNKNDVFGFETDEYLCAMTFDTARPYLNDTVTREDWEDGEDGYPRSIERISREAKDYLGFFLSKIEGERIISVMRAVLKYKAWKWLLGHPDEDTFPDGLYQRRAYDYLKAQVDSGEWDAMTKSANPEVAS